MRCTRCHYGFAELRFTDDHVRATALSDDSVQFPRHPEPRQRGICHQGQALSRAAVDHGKMGITEQTFYRWKKPYGGMGVGELRSSGV